MLKSICQGIFVLGFTAALASCGDFYGTAYPAVTVSNPTPPPASSSMHYGPSSDNPPASNSMHYGPSRPAVTVTNGSDAADSMHYGSN